MTRRWLALLVVGLALIGSAMAAPKASKPHHAQKKPKAKPGAGSGSAAGSAAGSGAGADAGSAAGSAAGAAAGAGSDSGSGSSTSTSTSSAPGMTGQTVAPPGLTPVEAPAKAPTMAMRPRAAHNGFIDKMNCDACHTPDGWELGAKAGASGFDHDRTGFPLRAAHKQTDCGGCHTSAGKPATTCQGCHADPHQGRNNGPCAECHTATAWSDTNTLERHRQTRMPLTGRHAAIDCVACHKRQSERQWSDVPVDCYACHRAEYHGSTHPVHDGRTPPGNPAFPRDCGRCHQTSGWSPATTDPALLPGSTARQVDHDAWFVLTTGPHHTADCAACHADERRPQVARCDGCHADVTLRQQHAGAAVPRGAAACLRCHPRGAAR